jgi:VanZ family protein
MITFFLNFRQPLRIFLVVIYVGCIAALSLLPARDFPTIREFPGFDKVVHFTMYFIFSFLLSWALKAELSYWWLLVVVPVTVGWGVFMEFMQLSMHLGRSFDVHDMMANTVGVLAGVVLYLLLGRRYAGV